MAKKFSLKHRLAGIKHPVRFWMLVSLGSVVAVLIALAVAAHLSWNAHQVQITERYQQAKQSTANVLGSNKLTLESLEAYEASLRQDAGELCRHGALGRLYRQVVASAEETHQRCLASVDRLAALSDQTGHMIDFIRSERLVTTAIAATQDRIGKLEPSQFVEIQAEWSQLGDRLDKLKVDKRLTPVLTSVKKSVAGIRDGYGKLAEAHKSENRVEFDTASTDIKNAHAQLTDTATQHKLVLDKLIKSLIDQAKSL